MTTSKGTQWTPDLDAQLVSLFGKGMKIRVIGGIMGRATDAVGARISLLRKTTGYHLPRRSKNTKSTIEKPKDQQAMMAFTRSAGRDFSGPLGGGL